MAPQLTALLLLAFVVYAHAGQFIAFPNQGRSNMIYIPSAATGNVKLPLVVMLHGCTQNPTDFAEGTQMNTYAEQYDFFALYPMQPQSSNQNECWNWFLPQHQSRGSGEPQIITSMVTAAAQQYAQINTSQVFVAGLSGAAMSIILGATYPDVFNAIASCSGLEYKAADSVTTAFTAMFSGGPSPATQGQVAYKAMGSYARPIGVYVFHGTSDTTVNYVNGQQSTAQYAATLQLILGSSVLSASATYTNSSQVPSGKAYTTAVYVNKASGEAQIQFTSVQGMNHAWSGGSNQGSYTDPTGPNASLLIWQFFTTFLHEASNGTTSATASTVATSATTAAVTTGPSTTATSASSSSASLSSSTVTSTTGSSTTGGGNSVATYNGQAGADGFVGQLTIDGYGVGIDKCGDKGMYNIDTYRTILSFQSQLPSGAQIINVTLSLTSSSSSGSLSAIAVDVKAGSFSGGSALSRSAYSALASASDIVAFSPPAVGATVDVAIPSSAWQYITSAQSTQFRLREVSTTPGYETSPLCFLTERRFTPNYVIFDDATVQLTVTYSL